MLPGYVDFEGPTDTKAWTLNANLSLRLTSLIYLIHCFSIGLTEVMQEMHVNDVSRDLQK